MTSNDLDTLHDELARLRAGEEDGWDQLTEPTPGQWLQRLHQAPAEQRLDVIGRLLAAAGQAEVCFFMHHEKRLEQDRHAWVALARIRDVIADMEQITGARHWARILRKVVDGDEPAPSPAANEPACDAYQPPTRPEDTGLCARCGMHDWKHHTPGPAATQATDTPERCCVCDGGPVVYHNYRERPFCWPCADCGCNQDACVRTGINDPAVSQAAAALREVLALFDRATVAGRTAFYKATEHPIAPDDMDRWRSALPKEQP